VIPFNVVIVPLTKRTTLRLNIQNRKQIKMKKKNRGTKLRFCYENMDERHD